MSEVSAALELDLGAIAGLRIGHWTDRAAGTGCTVVIPPPGTVGAADVRGGGASTRELALLDPLSGPHEVAALVLTGGSAFGLAAADGAVRWCEEQGLGLDVGVARVPIVPAAVIFDLGVTGNVRRPCADDGYAACRAARPGTPERGSVGVGTGATVGKLLGQQGWCKGGFGVGVVRLHDGATVAALAAVNAFGDVLDASGAVMAGAWRDDVGFVGSAGWAAAHPPVHHRLAAAQNTTLACVVTDARLTKVEAARVARMAQAGVSRTVNPASTTIDGDVVFCLATGAVAANPIVAGMAAAEAVTAAIRDAIVHAVSVRGVPTGTERIVRRRT